MTYHAKVIAGGKIVIPAELRRELGIADGDSIVLDRDPAGHVILRTRAQIVRDVREAFRHARGDAGGASVVDELIAERRIAARYEAADDDATPTDNT